MAKLARRIFTYRDNRSANYPFVANLLDQPVYIPYIGRKGYWLPPLTKDTEPMQIMLRPYKGLRKRQWQANMIEKDAYRSNNPNGIIAIGSFDEVQAAIEAKKPKD